MSKPKHEALFDIWRKGVFAFGSPPSNSEYAKEAHSILTEALKAKKNLEIRTRKDVEDQIRKLRLRVVDMDNAPAAALIGLTDRVSLNRVLAILNAEESPEYSTIRDLAKKAGLDRVPTQSNGDER